MSDAIHHFLMLSHREVPAALFRRTGVLRLSIFTDCEGQTCDFSFTDSKYEQAERSAPFYELAGHG